MDSSHHPIFGKPMHPKDPTKSPEHHSHEKEGKLQGTGYARPGPAEYRHDSPHHRLFWKPGAQRGGTSSFTTVEPKQGSRN